VTRSQRWEVSSLLEPCNSLSGCTRVVVGDTKPANPRIILWCGGQLKIGDTSANPGNPGTFHKKSERDSHPLRRDGPISPSARRSHSGARNPRMSHSKPAASAKPHAKPHDSHAPHASCQLVSVNAIPFPKATATATIFFFSPLHGARVCVLLCFGCGAC
jgi:hypothetical protein